tara:strand:- start:1419 stop:2807 length:1389 start_codon:yes stop_codon:yes gene_type:complete
MPKRVKQQKKKQTRYTRRKKQQKKRYTQNQKRKRGGDGSDLPPLPPLSQSQSQSQPFTPQTKKRSTSLSVPERPCKKNKKLYYDKADLDLIRIVERIGSESKNGTLIKIEEPIPQMVQHFQRNETDKFVLKIPKRDTFTNIVDNIVYEFEVGLFINEHFRPCYPCFLQTYDLIHAEDSNKIQSYIKKKDLLKPQTEENQRKETFSTLKVILPNAIDSTDPSTCENKHNYVVKIQYVSNGETLYDLLSKSVLDEYDINAILMQIYAPLYHINEIKKKTIFIHNDLHFNNIFVIKLKEPIHIEYTFSSTTTTTITTTITTQYLVKMIDYGRCHIPETKEFQTFYDGLNEEKESYQSYLINCGMRHVLYKSDDLHVFNSVQQKLSKNHEYNCKNLQDAYKLLTNFFNQQKCNEQSSFTLFVDGEKMTYKGTIPGGIDSSLFGENVMSQVTTENTTPPASPRSHKK